jgi:hypothetical protein
MLRCYDAEIWMEDLGVDVDAGEDSHFMHALLVGSRPDPGTPRSTRAPFVLLSLINTLIH